MPSRVGHSLHSGQSQSPCCALPLVTSRMDAGIVASRTILWGPPSGSRPSGNAPKLGRSEETLAPATRPSSNHSARAWCCRWRGSRRWCGDDGDGPCGLPTRLSVSSTKYLCRCRRCCCCCCCLCWRLLVVPPSCVGAVEPLTPLPGSALAGRMIYHGIRSSVVSG